MTPLPKWLGTGLGVALVWALVWAVDRDKKPNRGAYHACSRGNDTNKEAFRAAERRVTSAIYQWGLRPTLEVESPDVDCLSTTRLLDADVVPGPRGRR